MEINVEVGELLRQDADLGVLAIMEGVVLPPQVADLFEAADFRGRAGDKLLLYTRGAIGPRRLLLVGLGKREAVTAERFRQAGAVALQQARTLQVEAFSAGIEGDGPVPPERAAQALAEGIELGAYRYLPYRTGLSDEQRFEVSRVTVYTSGAVEPIRVAVATGQTIARGVAFARDLVNEPGSTMTPALLGDKATDLAGRLGLSATVLDQAQMKEQGFGGVLAVGQGSANEPRFIVMEYGAATSEQPTVCLVGKGITFDSGGLSIKPADAMETMKSDMGGAAAVYGTLQAAAEMALPLHLVGIVCAAENMPSATAFRPGDIVTTLSGKTIEVLNTDAEGRIVLADGLHYAQRYKPDAVIDLATLTGAIIVALGPHAIGMMGTSQDLADKVSQAGETSGERVWQLPLWDEYRDMVKSEVADLKNLGGRAGGSITAAAFLAAFVGDYPWIHLDVAGTAWVDRPGEVYESHGATGVGVRLLVELLRDYKRVGVVSDSNGT
ncbi:MAG: leucyl aminopeptidase [Candidatus Dormibacteraeota bacterium]|nr:leucyl aminopeptidase [Candidatus Dormibacteraeota bacterium]